MLSNYQKRESEYTNLIQKHEASIHSLQLDSERFKEELNDKNGIIANYQKKLRQQTNKLTSGGKPVQTEQSVPNLDAKAIETAVNANITNINQVNARLEQITQGLAKNNGIKLDIGDIESEAKINSAEHEANQKLIKYVQ